ncbi:hypothetical protein EJ02DRAFT_332514 [Clathrospora elynae]|uniref:Uncharacterized protein n=1 Tax=Clathrospora elynae TaxID=706981 RepID=A0A6A5T6I6_9PLEO|nr:hypothetical protein EJ02DRAFT_332514 [Clathrospora elynae]
MSKRNIDGDVITNMLNLGSAKHGKMLASWLGPQPQPDTTSTTVEPQEQDEDLKHKQVYSHETIGIGGIIPEDIEDGSFTKRIPTSTDKLLVTLLGNKKAKAHISAQREAARPNAIAKPQRYGKPTAAKEESEDEEEGRGAAFKSKRRRAEGKTVLRQAESDDEDEEQRAKRLGVSTIGVDKEVKETEIVQPAPRARKAKPKSFLDEVLAERMKKKQKKTKA